MPDDGTRKGGIPAWQLQKPEERSKHTKAQASPTSAPQPSSATAPQEQTLLDQALRFLNDDRTRESSDEDKITFLESKGLNKQEIDQVMAKSRETKSPTSSTPAAPVPRPPPRIPQREATPIITYPEFMVHSQKPPPIITAQRLVNTAYAAAGVAAVVYGASKYLIQPMFETLTTARHEFADHSKQQLDQLNEKLAAVVSVDPKASQAGRSVYHDDPEDDESSDSDPTELFHRDFGTQTSAELEKAADDGSSTTEADALDAVDWQNTKMQRIHHLCEDITSEEKSEADTAKEISSLIRLVNEQLEGLAMPTTSFNALGAYESSKNKKDDEISKMKTEIRSVKGALLSARNFPAGKR